MAKRSNAFQKLVKYIHDQVKGCGVTVTESAMLQEENIADPVLREVDVLIEQVTEGFAQRIAVECRDRAAPDDIQWIDGLIGKYCNLPQSHTLRASVYLKLDETQAALVVGIFI